MRTDLKLTPWTITQTGAGWVDDFCESIFFLGNGRMGVRGYPSSEPQSRPIQKGIYTAGVLDVFLEKGIFFDSVIGVSAGAIHGCSFVSKQKGRSIRYYKKYVNDPRYMSLRSLIKTGDYVGAEFCYHEIPEKLDVYDFEAFNANKTKFGRGEKL